MTRETQSAHANSLSRFVKLVCEVLDVHYFDKRFITHTFCANVYNPGWDCWGAQPVFFTSRRHSEEPLLLRTLYPSTPELSSKLQCQASVNWDELYIFFFVGLFENPSVDSKYLMHCEGKGSM